jgi:hypothetical protein
MKALYAARVSDLGASDVVKAECLECGHTEWLTGSMLLTAGLKPFTPILDLETRLRCRECDARGRALVTVRWGGDAS